MFFSGSAWGYVLLLYVIMQAARAAVLVLLYPILIHLGYGMNWKEAIIIVWSGLRGAVSLAMALSVNVSYIQERFLVHQSPISKHYQMRICYF